MTWLLMLLGCDSDYPEKRWAELAALKTPTSEQCQAEFSNPFSYELIPHAKSLCKSSTNPTCLLLSCTFWAEQEPVLASGLLQHQRPKDTIDRSRKQSIVRGLLSDKDQWQAWVKRSLPKKRSNWLGAAIAELDCDPQLGRSVSARMKWRCTFHDEISAKTLLEQAQRTAPARPEHTSLLHLAAKLHRPSVTPYLVQTLLNPELNIHQQRSAAVILSILEVDGFTVPPPYDEQLLSRCKEHPRSELTSFCQLRLRKSAAP